MTSRIERRAVKTNEPKMKKGAKTQLIVMIISVILMFFCITQVYYLARYTFGFEVKDNQMKVYKWITMLLN